jgi:hypothetical protein
MPWPVAGSNSLEPLQAAVPTRGRVRVVYAQLAKSDSHRETHDQLLPLGYSRVVLGIEVQYGRLAAQLGEPDRLAGVALELEVRRRFSFLDHAARLATLP